ncbi:MAG: hypothetical protein EZS28_035307 [Streblomastix strix]|uniref:Uncharacterized protein n=1 Tax=Streblomastix strix TaxID=222440 RepID=A0A5J4UEI2_9EUKA|nr:MAG: hypothetical protein EZS28_035307 [Streblomastix strix]
MSINLSDPDAKPQRQITVTVGPDGFTDRERDLINRLQILLMKEQQFNESEQENARYKAVDIAQKLGMNSGLNANIEKILSQRSDSNADQIWQQVQSFQTSGGQSRIDVHPGIQTSFDASPASDSISSYPTQYEPGHLGVTSDTTKDQQNSHSSKRQEQQLQQQLQQQQQQQLQYGNEQQVQGWNEEQKYMLVGLEGIADGATKDKIFKQQRVLNNWSILTMKLKHKLMIARLPDLKARSAAEEQGIEHIEQNSDIGDGQNQRKNQKQNLIDQLSGTQAQIKLTEEQIKQIKKDEDKLTRRLLGTKQPYIKKPKVHNLNGSQILSGSQQGQSVQQQQDEQEQQQLGEDGLPIRDAQFYNTVTLKDLKDLEKKFYKDMQQLKQKNYKDFVTRMRESQQSKLQNLQLIKKVIAKQRQANIMKVMEAACLLVYPTKEQLKYIRREDVNSQLRPNSVSPVNSPVRYESQAYSQQGNQQFNNYSGNQTFPMANAQSNIIAHRFDPDAVDLLNKMNQQKERREKQEIFGFQSERNKFGSFQQQRQSAIGSDRQIPNQTYSYTLPKIERSKTADIQHRTQYTSLSKQTTNQIDDTLIPYTYAQTILDSGMPVTLTSEQGTKQISPLTGNEWDRNVVFPRDVLIALQKEKDQSIGGCQKLLGIITGIILS